MDVHGFVALAILVAAVVLLSMRRLPVEVVALAIPVALYLTGCLRDQQDALAGFGSEALIGIAAMLVVGMGLREAGVTTLIARILQQVGGRSEGALVLVVMLAAASVSAFMSNVTVVAIFLPAVLTLARKTKVPASRLLMPLAFAAVLGGNLTLIGTQPNFIVADYGRSHLDPPHALGLFQFGLAGLPIAAAGIAFMVLAGRHLLPSRVSEDPLAAKHPEVVAQSYGLTRSLFRMKVIPRSNVRGRTLAESGIRRTYGLDLIAVARAKAVGHEYLDPRPDLVLAPGDELYLEGDDEAAWRFADYEMVQYGLAGPDEIEKILGRGMTVAELALAPRSAAIGRTVRDLGVGAQLGLTVLSIWRDGAAVRGDVADMKLQAGDALLVSGTTPNVRAMGLTDDYVLLTDLSMAEDVRRAPLASAILLLAIVPAVLSWLPVSVSALGAAVLMVATGCLSPARAMGALDFRALFLIVGTLPLGLALERQGVASVAAGWVMQVTSSVGPVAALAVIFGLASATSILTSHVTAAAVVTPVAASIGRAGGLPMDAALLATAYGCSCAYVLPIHPWNLLVLGPGGYTTRDFLRAGLGVSLVVATTALAVLALTR